jgi:hypothetical protein
MAKVAVLGLGPSLGLFVPADFDFAIGVNDIWQHHKCEYVVVVDKPERFNNEPTRLAALWACRPQRLYSQLDEWRTHPAFFGITLQHPYPTYICQLHLPDVPKSHCSPFVAAAIAYKYHAASEIHLFGVDLLQHPNLHPTTCQRIALHFLRLQEALKQHDSRLVVHGNGLLRGLNI